MQTLTTSGAIDQSFSANAIALNHSSVAIAATIAAPKKDQLMVITQTDAGTAGHTVTLTAGKFNTSGNNTLTFNAQDELIVLYGRSNLQYDVLMNIGSVGLSTV